MAAKNLIPELVIPESEHCEEITGWFEQENLERCSNCGSTLLRIYNENVPEGIDCLMLCAKCGMRLGGLINGYKREFYYYNGDTEHPFTCAPISDEAMRAFKYNPELSQPEFTQFIEHLQKLDYQVDVVVPFDIVDIKDTCVEVNISIAGENGLDFMKEVFENEACNQNKTETKTNK